MGNESKQGVIGKVYTDACCFPMKSEQILGIWLLMEWSTK